MDCVPKLAARRNTYLRSTPQRDPVSWNPCQVLHTRGAEQDAQNESEFWTSSVVAVVVSKRMTDIEVRGPFLRAKMVEDHQIASCSLCTPSSWYSWMEWLDGYPAWFRIESLTEYNHFSPSSFILFGDLKDAGVSVFTVLQICNNTGGETDRRAVCIERYKNELELMIGLKGESPEVLTEYAKRFRATGDRRNVHALSPLRCHPRNRLGPTNGSPDITILDLLRWIGGPLARSWQPFDVLMANSRHLAVSLQNFLRCGCPENKGMNRDIILAAVKEDGLNLQSAPEVLRANREIVLEAVSKDGSALEFVGSTLQADRDIVHAAVKNSGLALRFASKKLQADREIIVSAVTNNGRALLFASPEAQKDTFLILAAVRRDPWAMQIASAEMCGDPDFMLEAVKVRGTLLRYASDELRDDWKIVRAAVLQDGKALRLASEKLRSDVELQTLAHQDSGSDEELPTQRYKPRQFTTRVTHVASGRISVRSMRGV